MRLPPSSLTCPLRSASIPYVRQAALALTSTGRLLINGGYNAAAPTVSAYSVLVDTSPSLKVWGKCGAWKYGACLCVSRMVDTLPLLKVWDRCGAQRF